MSPAPYSPPVPLHLVHRAGRPSCQDRESDSRWRSSRAAQNHNPVRGRRSPCVSKGPAAATAGRANCAELAHERLDFLQSQGRSHDSIIPHAVGFILREKPAILAPRQRCGATALVIAAPAMPCARRRPSLSLKKLRRTTYKERIAHRRCKDAADSAKHTARAKDRPMKHPKQAPATSTRHSVAEDPQRNLWEEFTLASPHPRRTRAAVPRSGGVAGRTALPEITGLRRCQRPGQEGFLGLRRAVERFELRREVRFTTYAQSAIWGAMMDSLRRDDFGTAQRPPAGHAPERNAQPPGP